MPETLFERLAKAQSLASRSGDAPELCICGHPRSSHDGGMGPCQSVEHGSLDCHSFRLASHAPQ
jgi:hypothetical protein